MAKLTLLDPTKTGRTAQELESKLRRFVVGQEEAIHVADRLRLDRMICSYQCQIYARQ